jgi:hypothetical protein
MARLNRATTVEMLAPRGARAVQRALCLAVPIDPRAVNEVRHRLTGPIPVAREEVRHPAWIGRAAHAERVGPVLFDAALKREVDPAEDVDARLILGRRAL